MNGLEIMLENICLKDLEDLEKKNEGSNSWSLLSILNVPSYIHTHDTSVG